MKKINISAQIEIDETQIYNQRNYFIKEELESFLYNCLGNVSIYGKNTLKLIKIKLPAQINKLKVSFPRRPKIKKEN